MNLKKAGGAVAVGLLDEYAGGKVSANARLGGLAAVGILGQITGYGAVFEGASIASLSLLGKGLTSKVKGVGGASARAHSHDDGNALCELCVIQERQAILGR